MKDADEMTKATALVPRAAVLSLGLGGSRARSGPVVTGTATHAADRRQRRRAVAKPAVTCLNDLQALHARMQKDGYRLGGSSDAYGYPIGDGGYDGCDMGPYPSTILTRYPSK
jgi:hypothetical protein